MSTTLSLCEIKKSPHLFRVTPHGKLDSKKYELGKLKLSRNSSANKFINCNFHGDIKISRGNIYDSCAYNILE